MQSACKVFDQEIEALKREVGEDVAAKTLLVFSEAICWQRTCGHGNLTLSAIHQKFSSKLRADTVIDIKDR